MMERAVKNPPRRAARTLRGFVGSPGISVWAFIGVGVSGYAAIDRPVAREGSGDSWGGLQWNRMPHIASMMTSANVAPPMTPASHIRSADTRFVPWVSITTRKPEKR